MPDTTTAQPVRTVEESLALVDNILYDTGSEAVTEPVVTNNQEPEVKVTDDTITEVDAKSEDTTNDGGDKEVEAETKLDPDISETEKDDTKADKVEDDTTEKEPAIEQEPETEKTEEVDSPLQFSQDLINLGIDSEDKITELHQSWSVLNDKVNSLKEKEDLLYLLEAEKIDDVGNLAVAIKALSGDKSAIYKLLNDNNIDPIDLITSDDEKIDEFKYDNSTIDASKAKASEKTVLDTAIAIAVSGGVGREAFIDTIGSWDESSFKDIVNDPKNVKVMTEEVKSGRYTEVMAEVQKIKNSDFSNTYAGKDSFDMYKIGSENLNNKTKKSEPEKKAKKDIPEKEVTETSDSNDDRIASAKKATQQSEAAKVASNTSNNNHQSNPNSGFKSDDELFAYIDSLVG